jgi:alpha-amylase
MTTTTRENTANPGGGVMMQAFTGMYLLAETGGGKYKSNSMVKCWYRFHWLPPVSKAQNGPFSMGYDPTDYFDFGNYNQNGTIETRFGSKTELVNLITKAHTENIQVYADIVLNHNSGGQLENNLYRNTNLY